MAKHRHRATKADVVEYYLPLALVSLQVETATELQYAIGGHRREFGGQLVVAAMRRIVESVKASLADEYARRMHGTVPLWSKAYSELSDTDHKALRQEAEKLKKWAVNENSRIYCRHPFDSSSFKWAGQKDTKIGAAIKVAADTIKTSETRIAQLRFVVDHTILSRKNRSWHDNRGRGDDSDFYSVLEYLFEVKQRAWISLLMFCGMAGGDLQRAATRAAAMQFAGLGEKRDDFVKTGIMHFLETDLLDPGMYDVEDEEGLRDEIAAAIG